MSDLTNWVGNGLFSSQNVFASDKKSYKNSGNLILIYFQFIHTNFLSTTTKNQINDSKVDQKLEFMVSRERGYRDFDFIETGFSATALLVMHVGDKLVMLVTNFDIENSQ